VVCIVRRNESKEVDGTVNVINQDAHAEHITQALLKIINATGV
jgi:hypothetical protein